MRIGFTGLGRMGLPMASHLHSAGYDVVGYDKDAAARSRGAAAGLSMAESPLSFADREAICSSLPDTSDVQEAYLAAGGILEVVVPGTICVDLSTISVDASRAIAVTAAARGVAFLDAPVSGTSIHAAAGTLAVMVGGDSAALERVRPALECFSSSVNHIGGNGNGLLLKLITNRLLTAHLTAIAEAIVEMETVGLDVDQGIEIVRAGAVPKLLDYKAAPLIARDFTPKFSIDLMRKDLRLAAEVLPAVELASLTRQILEQAAAAGHGADDVAALITALEAEVATP